MFGPLINPPPGGAQRGAPGDPLTFGGVFAVLYWLFVISILGAFFWALLSIGEQIAPTPANGQAYYSEEMPPAA